MSPAIVAATLFALAAGARTQEQTAAATDQATPGVVQANTESARHVQARKAGRAAINSDLQAQYADDMAAYRQQVVERQIAIATDQTRYDHQQRAYADAMRAWRTQVDDCKHGHARACRAPTPNPADFW